MSARRSPAPQRPATTWWGAIPWPLRLLVWGFAAAALPTLVALLFDRGYVLWRFLQGLFG